ncbi:MAG: NACHT domain-containing protein, partial [Bryobacterales bacterium]|nr:NACHT domain-containing protein [Bryobacterales bacterium]
MPHRRRKLPKALTTGRHHLWDYLQAGQNLAVVGGPGSGKTTLLRHVCLIVAAGHRASPHAPVIRRLPVLLFLRSCAKRIAADPHYALADAIEQGEIVKGQEKKPPAGWWAEQLVKDRCLVLFDGLDEVANAEVRAKVAEWVDKAMKRHAGNLFVTTSRPGGYRENPLSGVTILGVRPFSPRQVRAFVDNWYLANEMAARNPADPGAEQQARHEAQKGAKDLLHRLRGSLTLTDLAVNPLLLTMIAT